MLKRSLQQWIAGVIAVLVAIWLAQNLGLTLEWSEPWRVAVFVPVLALANTFVAPLLRLLCKPISCLTFGLFGFVINALVFWIAGAATEARMEFLSALLGSIVVSTVGSALSGLVKERRR